MSNSYKTAGARTRRLPGMSSVKALLSAGAPAPVARSAALGLVKTGPGRRTTAWVVDADAASRSALVEALERIPGVAISGESAGGVEALEEIRRARPDMVFLSVELPGLSGFDVLEALAVLEGGFRPSAVFLASDERHAARAFEADACDCVVRPFSPERIAAAVRRARGRSGVGQPAPPRRLEDWLLVKKEGRSVFVRLADIDWIESARNNVILHVGPERYVHHETTSGVEARLSPSKFLRIHRSAIVRIDRIKELKPWFNGEYRLTLKDGTQLTLSEGYRDRLKRFR
jgi:two-component system, LytTR family, response regulator